MMNGMSQPEGGRPDDQAMGADPVETVVQVLAEAIGGRGPGSEQERSAAAYVRGQLMRIGIGEVREQPFRTPRSAGATFLPYAIAGLVGALLARRGRLGRLAGGVTMLASGYGMIKALKVGPHPFLATAADADSQNVIARIPSTGETRRFVILTAHLDTSKQRFTVPGRGTPALTRPLLTASLLAAFGAGAAAVISAFTEAGKPDRASLARMAGNIGRGTLAAVAASLILDEREEHLPGANDNASGVAALLRLAAELHAKPLAHTEVILLFTGACTANGIGVHAYLDQYAPPRDFTTFINLLMVGGNETTLSYITRGGITALSDYRPAPKITALVNRVANRHPEYGVYGKQVTVMDEMAGVRGRGYEAITLTGLQGGALPHWHRMSDTADTVNPEQIERAAAFTRLILGELDG